MSEIKTEGWVTIYVIYF